uniref:ShKT domain-containing protein n=1 Tax=Strongyloides venezuelensis TaxID=75913 RepID=A0A0K0FTL2_STRVS
MIFIKFIFVLTIFFNKCSIIKAAPGSTCATKNDCGTGYSCVLLPSGNSFVNLCIQSCSSNTDCNGGTCDANPSGSPTDITDKMCSTAICPISPTCITGQNAECLGDQKICSLYDLTCRLSKFNEICSSNVNCITGLTCQSGKCQTVITTTTITTTAKALTTASATCVDLVTGGSNDCSSLASYCKNALYLSLMKEKCPKTCGFCTTSVSGTTKAACADLTNSSGSSDCTKNAYLCTNTIYKDLMKTQCPKTCGYC